MSVIEAMAPAEALRARQKRSAKTRRIQLAVLITAMLAGILSMLYPVVATGYNNYKQQEFARKYGYATGEADRTKLDAELTRARLYNETIDGIPILDPYLAKVSQDRSAPYMKYLDQLNSMPAMARVRVPTANINLPVYHGTADNTIAKGAGHLYGTSLPVGGTNTHTVLTSHTGMTNATLFDELTKVQLGDRIYVDVNGLTLAYQVTETKKVLPNELDDLKPEMGKDMITLFTCWPYGVNTHRLLVTGMRVQMDPKEVPPPPSVTEGLFHFQDWMLKMMGLSAAGLLVIALMITSEVRTTKKAWRKYQAALAKDAEEALAPAEAPEGDPDVPRPDPEPER